MVTTVFISHSCKDNELNPPAGLSAGAAAKRAQRLQFARDIRDQLHDRLKKDHRFQVFLDVRGGLKAGDVWRSGLHTALRTCAAGIVLLTPESLESGWVLKEATILSWRVFLGEPVVLIPIVLGVSSSQLEERGFGALQLDAIQWVRVATSDEAGMARAVKETLDVLESSKVLNSLAAARTLTPTEVWIQEFAVCVGKAVGAPPPDLKKHYLSAMCGELAIAPTDSNRFDGDPLVNIASHALLAEDNQIIRLLRHAGAPSEAQREELRQQVAALWVDATPASRLLASAGPVVAIDARETSTAREYVARARCNKVDWDRVVEPENITEGSDAEVLAEIKRSLQEILPIEDATELRRDIKENGPCYVILGFGSTRPTVLDAVTSAYPPLTFIVAAGPKPQEKLGSWWGRAVCLYPLLQQREAAALRFRNRLLKFVKGMPQ